jgi:hypothetical protein
MIQISQINTRPFLPICQVMWRLRIMCYNTTNRRILINWDDNCFLHPLDVKLGLVYGVKSWIDTQIDVHLTL